MSAVTALEPGTHWLSFKCTPESFMDLVERPGIVPAPYLARASWVALQSTDALPPAQLGKLLHEAYDLVFAKLPKGLRTRLAGVSNSAK